jgi:hypothetical protein
VAWKGKEMEWLIAHNDRLAIQQSAYPKDQSYSKTHFNRAVQELYLTDKRPIVAAQTLQNFQQVIEFCREKLEAAAAVPV